MSLPSVEDARAWIGARSARAIALRIAAAVAVLALAGGLAFYAYFGVFAHHAPEEVRESVRANENVTVTEDYGGFVVSDADPEVERLGVVFYPGGRVAPDAYLPTAARLAERANVTVVVPKMRANLAVFSIGRADAVLAGEGNVSRWVVGGHSLGGAMACRYAGSHPDAVDGLLLVGAYCDQPVRGLPALTVVGTRDSVLDREQFADSRANLPADATVERIEGMNHSQAGSYGGQRGDRSARIGTDDAHRRVATAVTQWLCDEFDHCGVGRDGSARDALSPSATLR
ncbi:alpha/beta hydrolase [Halosimplex litoreum]|uniref:Alpha/beta hydrolase n=1 Tax=Halosimplex litoreum TaxID=1198301 RepID=A0A7T3G137_9EURY|nr:alpha/beta fold hydrolase [Halosimplex litoreum]QPV64207.1 alpha/beta hydrolase [Halosimplex litoreum]